MGDDEGDPEDDEVSGEDVLEAGYDSQIVVAFKRFRVRLHELNDAVEFRVSDSDVEPALQ